LINQSEAKEKRAGMKGRQEEKGGEEALVISFRRGRHRQSLGLTLRTHLAIIYSSPLSLLLLELLVSGNAQGSQDFGLKGRGGLVMSKTLVGQAVDEQELSS